MFSCPDLTSLGAEQEKEAKKRYREYIYGRDNYLSPDKLFTRVFKKEYRIPEVT